MSFRSKPLVQAAMMLRPKNKQFSGRLHPNYVRKLVRITQ